MRAALACAATQVCACAAIAAYLFTTPLRAADPPRPRDAAEAVREGDVSQWLKYYERERAAEWQRSQRERIEERTPTPAAEPDERRSPPQR